jgi:hypothetical protein
MTAAQIQPSAWTAKAQSWDSTWVYVLCPFCNEVHDHRFNGDCRSCSIQEATCNISRGNRAKQLFAEYKIQFPNSEAGFSEQAYEIDKDIMRFVVAGARGLDRPCNKVSDAEAEEMRAQFRKSLFRAKESTGPPILFAEDEQDEQDKIMAEGLEGTALHLAAGGASPEMARLLIREGSNVNAIKLDGRTPLMEAALWGRLENVVLLLDSGADKDLSCIDHVNRVWRAADLANPTETNARIRHQSAGGSCNDESYASRQDRRLIVLLLRGQPPAQVERVQFGASLEGDTDDKSTLYFATRYSLPEFPKTMAILIRGGGLPEISVISGWLFGLGEYGARRNWTDEVLRLCEHIGHELPEHEKDKGVPGRFHACHSEKKLVAYFVHKHLFLDHETMSTPEESANDHLTGFSNLTLTTSTSSPLTTKTDRRKTNDWGLGKLSKARPPVSLRKATILVSRAMCRDCTQFVDSVNQLYNLEIRVQSSIAML